MEHATKITEARQIDAQIVQMRAIYERLFPTQTLHYVMTMGEDPFWSAPKITEGPYTPEASDMGPQFLGGAVRPGAYTGAPEVTIRIDIPRPPLPSEQTPLRGDWAPIAPLKPIFEASPMLYEQIRYHAEMRRKRLCGRRHPARALPFSPGATRVQRPPPPTKGIRPAALIGMHWLETGGAEKLGLDSIRWSLKAGLRVFVVAAVPALQSLEKELPDHEDLSFIRLDRWLPHSLWPRYIAQLIKAENISLVHIHHCTPLYASLPMIRAQAPWVRVIDSTHIVEHADGGFPRMSGVWTNFLDAHHVISAGGASYLQARFLVPPHKVLMGRMLARPGRAATPPPLRLTAEQEALHIAFVGRMEYQKRPVIAVLILRALCVWTQRNGIALSATFIGDGPFRAPVGQLLRRYGLCNMVTQLPGDADVPKALRGSDILILPSNNEGLALVCYEAIQNGCIPISTDVGAQDELLPDGLLVPLPPHRTVGDTVARIAKLWEDADFLRQQKEDLTARMEALTQDPTAEEVLTPVYEKAARATRTGGAG